MVQFRSPACSACTASKPCHVKHSLSDCRMLVDCHASIKGSASARTVVAQKTGGNAAVSSVALRGANGQWVPMNNVWGASWESTSVPMPPLDFRIQDDAGTEVSHRTPKTCHPLRA